MDGLNPFDPNRSVEEGVVPELEQQVVVGKKINEEDDRLLEYGRSLGLPDSITDGVLEFSATRGEPADTSAPSYEAKYGVPDDIAASVLRSHTQLTKKPEEAVSEDEGLVLGEVGKKAGYFTRGALTTLGKGGATLLGLSASTIGSGIDAVVEQFTGEEQTAVRDAIFKGMDTVVNSIGGALDLTKDEQAKSTFADKLAWGAGGLVSQIAQAVALGPVAGTASAAAMAGADRARALIKDEGVDTETAIKVAATEALSTAIQTAIPVSRLGLKSKIALDTLVSPVVGGAADYLNNKSFGDKRKDLQVDPLDPERRGLDAALGAVGGTVGAIATRNRGKETLAPNKVSEGKQDVDDAGNIVDVKTGKIIKTKAELDAETGVVDPIPIVEESPPVALTQTQAIIPTQPAQSSNALPARSEDAGEQAASSLPPLEAPVLPAKSVDTTPPAAETTLSKPETIPSVAETIPPKQENLADVRETLSSLKSKSADALTPDELRMALLRNEVTALKNKRAYEFDERLPVQTFVDVQGLKFANDRFGHDAGDNLIRHIGDTIHEVAGDKSYHFSGDEFGFQSRTQAEADATSAKINELLSQRKIRMEDADGEYEYTPRVRFGHGATLKEADLAANAARRPGTEENRKSADARAKVPDDFAPVVAARNNNTDPAAIPEKKAVDDYFVSRETLPLEQALTYKPSDEALAPDAQLVRSVAEAVSKLTVGQKNLPNIEIDVRREPALGMERTSGAYFPDTNTAVLFPSRIDPKHVEATALHEIFHHDIFTAVEPSRVKQILANARLNKEVRELEQRWLKNNSFGDSRVTRGMATEEALAQIASRGQKSTIIDRVVTSVRSGLRKAFPTLKVTDGEIRSLISSLRNAEVRFTNDGAVRQADQRIEPKFLEDGELSVNQRNEPRFSQDGDNLPTPGRKPGFISKKKAQAEDTRTVLQDQDLPIRRMQEAIVKRGGKLEEGDDYYDARNKIASKVTVDMEDNYNPLFDKFAKQLRETGISLKEIGDYRTALHALERNPTIAARNKKLGRFQDGSGSGMTTAKAQTIIALAKRDPERLKALDSLSDTMSEVTAKRRELAVKYGLLTPEEIAAFPKWKHYVPLKDVPDDIEVGSRFAFGLNEKAALGRESEAQNPAIQIFHDLSTTIRRGRKNEAEQALLSLALKNPDPKMYVVDPTPTKLVLGDDGQVKTANDIFANSGDNVHFIKREGDIWKVVFKDAEVARAAKPIETPKWVNSAALKFSRLVGSNLTRYSLNFISGNKVRDVQTAGGYLYVKEGPAIAKRFIANQMPTMRALYQHMRTGDAKNPAMQKYIEEWRAGGGKTAGIAAVDPEVLERNLRIEAGQYNNTVEAVFRSLEKGTIKPAAKFLENVGALLEDSTRVAVYAAARQTGKSQKDAATLAKDAPTNFDRRGRARWIGSVYMFANPAIQDARNLVHAAKTSPKRATAMISGLLGAGILVSLYNEMVSPVDEDGMSEWSKQNLLTSRSTGRNLTLQSPSGSGRSGKLPLAHGWRAAFDAGQMIHLASIGAISPTDASTKMATSVIDTFSPLGIAASDDAGKNIMNLVAPTLFDQLVDLYAKESSLGTPMDRRASVGSFDKIKDDQRAATYFDFNSTTEPGKAIAKTLSKATGGSDARGGWVNLSGGQIDYLAKNYITGYADIARGVSLLNKSKEDIRASDVPIAGVFLQSKPDYKLDQSIFYKNLKIVKGELLDAPDKANLIQLEKEAGRVTKKAAAIRDEIEILRKKKDKIALGQARVKEKELSKLFMGYNKSFNEAKKVNSELR